MRKSRKLLRTLKLIVITTLISACCKPELITVSSNITILPLPYLPPLSSKQKHAIMQPTFLILVEREEKLKAHIHRQKELIRINNAK